ncbi:hypothetical protein HYU19_05870 [Candidatus Woesearchaeota archaeon]|nr:hypothetical protein [Candidatus Woesearchaeota archaeon]
MPKLIEQTASRERARSLLVKLGDLHLTVQRAWDSLPDADRQFFEAQMQGKRSDTIQGLLGEVLGLSVMYRLLEADPSSFSIYSGTPGQTAPPRSGYSITFRKSGKNIIITDRRTVCEIDNLGMYDGIPIIFESKTGKATATWKDVVWQRHYVERYFGTPPFFVEISTQKHRNLEYLGADRYRVVFPLLDEIRAKALSIASEAWTVK